MKAFGVSLKHERLFDIVKLILGFVALLVGILGLLFPILPGWLLIFVGLELVGIKIVLFDRIKEYARDMIRQEKGRKKK